MIAPALSLSALLAFAPVLAPPPVAFEELDRGWAATMREIDVPGLAIAVVVDGQIAFEKGYGHRDLAARKPVDPETLFYTASTTKAYTALEVLALASDGKIELDAPVRRYLPRFAPGGDGTVELTVRDLLTHRRGLQGEIPLTFHEAFTGMPMSEDFFYATLSGYVRPTGRFVYGNLHFTLLGRVVESVTGKDWRLVLRERVLDPAGLKRTTTSA